MEPTTTFEDFEHVVRLIPGSASDSAGDEGPSLAPEWLEALLPLFIDVALSPATSKDERLALVQKYAPVFEPCCPARIQEVRRASAARTMAGTPTLSGFIQGFLRLHVSDTALALLNSVKCPTHIVTRFSQLTVPVPHSLVPLYPPGGLTPAALAHSPFAPSLVAQLSRLANMLAPEEDYSASTTRIRDLLKERAARYTGSKNPARALLSEAWLQAPPIEGLSLAEATVPTGATTLSAQAPNIYLACHVPVTVTNKTRAADPTLQADADARRDQFSNMAAISRVEALNLNMRCPLVIQPSSAVVSSLAVAPSSLMFEAAVARPDECAAMAVSLSGRWVAAALRDHTICVWSYAASVSQDGADVVSLAAAHSARPLSRRVLVGHSARITSLDFSTDGKFILSGDVGGEVRIWSTQHASLVSTVLVLSPVWQVAFAPGGGNFAVASSQGLAVYSFAGVAPLRLFPAFGAVTCVSWHPSGLVVAVAGDDTVIRLYSLLQGRPLRQDEVAVAMDIHRGHSPVAVFTGHNTPPNCLAFSPDGTVLASGDQEGVLLFHDMLPLPGATVKQDIFSYIHMHHQQQYMSQSLPQTVIPEVPFADLPQDLHLALSSDRAVPLMARFDTRKLHQTTRTGIRTLAWAQHGEACAAVGADGLVSVWNTALIRLATTPQDVCTRLNQLREHRGFKAFSAPKDLINVSRLEELGKWMRLHSQTQRTPEIPLELRPDVIPSLEALPSVLEFLWLTESEVMAAKFGLTSALILASFRVEEGARKQES